MSADNWSECKICEKKKEELMGKLTAKEYGKIKKSFKHPEYDTDEQVREDYEIYFDDDGNWVFDGGAECGVCGTQWRDKKIIKPKNKPDWSHLE